MPHESNNKTLNLSSYEHDIALQYCALHLPDIALHHPPIFLLKNGAITTIVRCIFLLLRCIILLYSWLLPAHLPTSSKMVLLSSCIFLIASWQVHAGQALTPYGIFQFCKIYPAQCRKTKPATVQYNRRLIALLSNINTSVNARIKPGKDVVDEWRINPRRGDCDDYMVTKRAELIRAGIPAGAVIMIIVKLRSGQGHALTGVRSSSGLLILDNLDGAIKHISRTRYIFMKRSTSDPMVWISF